MKIFVNEYEYTFDVISESISAWWRRKYNFKMGCISSVLLALLIFLISLYKERWMLFAALIPLPFLYIIFILQKMKMAVKLEKEKIKVIFPDSVPILQVEIGEDICMITPKSETRVQFSDIEDIIVTKNLIILMVKGMMTVTLDKKGFKQGNAGECLEYLKGHIRK